MKIRRFTGATMQQALSQVKAALGDDAVILETTYVPGGVSVTAAMDDDPVAGAVVRDQELVGEVRKLLRVVRDLVEERQDALGSDVLRLHRLLVAQGVDGVIAAALVRETSERLAHGGPLDAALADALAPERTAAATRVRLFVGPPGDGKTTTIAKLAAQARQAGRRVALVGTDTYRVGASAELATYGRALGLPVFTAGDPATLAATRGRVGDAEVVLVDTPGAGPGQAAELDEVAALARAAGPGVGRTLVASAAAGSWAARETAQAFAPLSPDACVLTKLDLAPGGPMLGVCWKRGIPISHVAAGRRIPDDLEQATAERLARCLLAA
jgi:flagellar biosynthesis protein FlhF